MTTKCDNKGRHVIKKYIKSGNLHKLKSFMKKHNIDVNSRLRKEQTLLHATCKEGHGDLLKYLLRKGADPGLRDANGCLPLHIALRRVVNGEYDAYEHLVKPLLEASAGLLDVPDSSGTTVRDLLDVLSSSANDVESSGSSSSEHEDTDDDVWHKKLANELQNEGASWDRYETDYLYESDRETPDEWNERIRMEYFHKHHHHVSHGKKRKCETESERRKQQRTIQEQKEFLLREEIAKRFRLREEKVKYELQWKTIMKKDNMVLIKYGDIPWPEKFCDIEKLEEWLFCDIDINSTSEMKKILREQQIRWHPDKFLQKLGPKLHLNHKEQILDKVKEISQMINALSDKASSN